MDTTARARDLRKAQTRAENRLWSWLRDRRFGNYKFRRQHPAFGYYLDFYCAKLKLAIELDGSHHRKEWMDEYDTARTEVLRRGGIEVLRIPNESLIRDALAVSELIRHTIASRDASP